MTGRRPCSDRISCLNLDREAVVSDCETDRHTQCRNEASKGQKCRAKIVYRGKQGVCRREGKRAER